MNDLVIRELLEAESDRDTQVPGFGTILNRDKASMPVW